MTPKPKRAYDNSRQKKRADYGIYNIAIKRPWVAYIEKKRIGSFATEEEARAARDAALAKAAQTPDI